MTEEFAKSAVVVLNTLNIHNKDDLKRAYHHLVTSFHPDNTTGDEIGFKNLQIFYDFMNTNLSLFVNKPNIDSDFNICLNTTLFL